MGFSKKGKATRPAALPWRKGGFMRANYTRLLGVATSAYRLKNEGF